MNVLNRTAQSAANYLARLLDVILLNTNHSRNINEIMECLQHHHKYLQYHHNSLMGAVNTAHLTQGDLISRLLPKTDSAEPVRSSLQDYAYPETLKRFAMEYRDRFELWQRLCRNAEKSYQDAPVASVSVANHPVANYFLAFARPRLRGRVLDIGCGPVRTPLYLHGYPMAAIAAIDPFGDQSQHDFMFVNAVAENIPWSDESFDTLIAATSLDHLFDPAAAMSEMRRVLRPDGQMLVWVSFVPGSRRFPPESDRVEPIDQFHLYHFDMQWFEHLLEKEFVAMERFNIDGASFFYRYAPRST